MFGGRRRAPGTQPNSFFWFLWLGAAALAAGTVTLGLGLLLA
ncbi:hypothetical protein [Phytohabitans kaempferiae]|uniref:Uncharacterized protein n=1 Tax=Phytohabitans kaempferiae TaxID=1620943 RepID=A0ABV6M1P2_9ACTN